MCVRNLLSGHTTKHVQNSRQMKRLPADARLRESIQPLYSHLACGQSLINGTIEPTRVRDEAVDLTGAGDALIGRLAVFLPGGLGLSPAACSSNDITWPE